MKIMNKNIIINSIKIVLAAVISIILAEIAELDFSIAAGIVAILTIQPTKKETVNTALGRLYAFVVALVIAYVSFTLIGYNIPAFFVYLVIFIFVCQIFKWYSAMAMNSVLISHFVSLGVMNMDTLINEVMIFVIGVGIGIVANLHLRKKTDYIEQLKKEADEQIVRILSRMAERIINKDISDYNGECFVRLKDQISMAKTTALENYNNQFNSEDTFDLEYIDMRDKQYQVLYEMYKSARQLDSSPSTAERIAHFLKSMSEVFHKDNDCKALMEEFKAMDDYMETQPLPVTRQEFEDRAHLYVLMRNIEVFIQIKLEFAKAQ